MLKENAYFNMGDHGGIIVAVKFNQKSVNSSFEIMYSLDVGETWQYYKMDNMTLKLYSLMTEPGENTTVFSLFASPPGNIHRWIVVKADFRKAFGKLINKVVLHLVKSYKVYVMLETYSDCNVRTELCEFAIVDSYYYVFFLYLSCHVVGMLIESMNINGESRH